VLLFLDARNISTIKLIVIIENVDFYLQKYVPGWMGRRVCVGGGGWMDVKIVLKIAYNNQKVRAR
jgi:hypothetical protein